jgi:hypothetical protein
MPTGQVEFIPSGGAFGYAATTDPTADQTTHAFNPGVGDIVLIANGGTGANTAPAALTSLGAAPSASPTFTGVPAAPTAPVDTNTTQLATTAYFYAGLPLPPFTWNVAGAGVTVLSQSSITRASGGGSWDGQGYSTEGYAKNVYISFQMSLNPFQEAGLSATPAGNAAQANLDYGFFVNGAGAIQYTEGGVVSSFTVSPPTATAATVFLVSYDGVNIRYYIDGVLYRTVARAISGTLSANLLMNRTGFGYTNVQFGQFIPGILPRPNGVATLASGTVVVSTPAVTANSRILLTTQSLGTVTVPSALCVSARTPGTSFTILASVLTDTSVVAWELIEVA